MKRYFLLIALALGCAMTTQAQITAPVETSPAETVNPDAKYLVPIPLEENGMVYLERVLPLPEGTNKDETLAKMKDWVDRCMKDERILNSSPLEAEQPYSLSQMVRQEIVFSSSLLSLDKAEISYALELSLKDNNMILKLRRISFRYSGDNPERKMLRHAAEDYIADKVALNKRGDKIIRGYRKFRVKTIDLVDEYAASLKMAFWIK